MADKFQTLEKLITLLPGVPEDTRRALVEGLCNSGLKTIERLVDQVGDPKHPVDVAVSMINVALKTGHTDVLNSALDRVDITWPPEIVVAIWAATATAADKLPAREDMWARFESRVLR